tara:strand:+ start:26100 stop:28805 length:2706 start_codon:yes stop_codon:yes gene_type:complete
LWWYACEGFVDTAVCKSNFDERGSFSLPVIYPGTIADYSSSNSWNPSGDEGTYTIVYAFDLQDQDPSDDALTFHINLTRSFVDLAIDTSYDPTSILTDLAVYSGNSILNTNVNYDMQIVGSVTACGTCNFVAEIGWQLWNEDESMMLAESYTNVSNLPSWGGVSSFSRAMPTFTHSSQGTFNLVWGMFSSTGTPYADLNSENDLSKISIIFDDTIDLQATSMVPGHDSTSSNYYFGEDMVHSTITNKGNLTIAVATISFQVYDQIGDVEDEIQCILNDLKPGEVETCMFNLTTVGDGRTLTISVPVNFDEGTDAKMGDNSLSELTDILAGDINAVISQSNPLGTYTTGDYIEMVARTGSTAAAPLNYSWWVSGIINLGYGQLLNISGSVLGLGDHTITLRVTDNFGELETVHEDITLYNYVSLDNEPYFTGQAVTRSVSYLNHDSILPVLGTQYGIGEGREPLLLLSFEVLATEDNSNNTGMDYMNLHLNTSALLPENIPLDTVDIRFLPTLDDNIWTVLDIYTKNEDHSFDVTLDQNGVILIIGNSPAANISIGEVEFEQREGGIIELQWDPSGDTGNPYIGSWNIYKLTVENNAGTIFPSPYPNFNEFIWETLTLDTLVASVDTETTSWIDPSPLATNTCASYAVMPANREGIPDFLHIEVSRDDSGQPVAFCGDAIPPEKAVSNLQYSVTFTNDSECYKIENDWSMCYDLNMTWTWPEQETTGDVTWNLYRTDQQPAGIDLSFLTPLETGLTGDEGETGYYNQSGIEDENIRPYRTFYYVLAPVDSVGNQLLEVNYPVNSARIVIQDQWWDYNQHLIPIPPPEPEPPLGVEWLGTLSDYMEVDEFKTTGLVALITLVMSMISLPLIIKKRKRLSRIMKARNRRAGARVTADEFEDFFD